MRCLNRAWNILFNVKLWMQSGFSGGDRVRNCTAGRLYTKGIIRVFAVPKRTGVKFIIEFINAPKTHSKCFSVEFHVVFFLFFECVCVLRSQRVAKVC